MNANNTAENLKNNQPDTKAIADIREIVRYRCDDINRVMRIADNLWNAVSCLASASRICQNPSVCDASQMSYDAERQYRLSNVSGALHDAVGHLACALDDIREGDYQMMEWVEQCRIALVDVAYTVDTCREFGIESFNRIVATTYDISAHAYQAQSLVARRAIEMKYAFDSLGVQ